jgi:hypothetical protein
MMAYAAILKNVMYFRFQVSSQGAFIRIGVLDLVKIGHSATKWQSIM